jgi:hypothetical protein
MNSDSATLRSLFQRLPTVRVVRPGNSVAHDEKWGEVAGKWLQLHVGGRVTHLNQCPEQVVSLYLTSGLLVRISMARSSVAVVATALLEEGKVTHCN